MSRHAQQKYHFSSGLTHTQNAHKKSAATPLDRKSMKKRSRRAIIEEKTMATSCGEMMEENIRKQIVKRAKYEKAN
jgi:hypothetical protein